MELVTFIKWVKTCKSECQWCWSLKQRCAILPIQGKKPVAFVLYAIAWRTLHVVCLLIQLLGATVIRRCLPSFWTSCKQQKSDDILSYILVECAQQASSLAFTPLPALLWCYEWGCGSIGLEIRLPVHRSNMSMLYVLYSYTFGDVPKLSRIYSKNVWGRGLALGIFLLKFPFSTNEYMQS